MERGTRQGDPISAYLFILAFEVFFILVKSDKNVHGLSTFEHEFLYTAYADDATFFLKDLNSVKAVLCIANIYSKFSGLYPNLSKCEIAGIGVLKGANVALCGMKTLDLVNESIKILGIHISYNKSHQNDLNFCETVKNMCNVLNLWKMRHLTIEGKITVFKSLAISKIVYLSLLTSVPKCITDELKIIQKSFLWGKKKPKNKHQTLCNDFKDGGLKNVDIEHKIESLKCSWTKRLYDENFHEWKIIPIHYISKTLGKNFKFHSNLILPLRILEKLPIFYKDVFQCWSNISQTNETVPSAIGSHFLWFNSQIKVDKHVIFYKEFSEKNLHF